MIMKNQGNNINKFLISNTYQAIIFNKSQIPVMCINPIKPVD